PARRRGPLTTATTPGHAGRRRRGVRGVVTRTRDGSVVRPEVEGREAGRVVRPGGDVFAGRVLPVPDVDGRVDAARQPEPGEPVVERLGDLVHQHLAAVPVGDGHLQLPTG